MLSTLHGQKPSALVFLCVTWGLLFGSACAQDATKEAEDLIRAVYRAHQPWNNTEIERNDRAVLATYFDERLVSLFMRDDDCASRLGMCNLDFDPFLNAQDFEDNPELNLRIEKASPEPELAYRVTFHSIVDQTLIYHLRRSDSGWRITDIEYPDRSSLVRILSAPHPKVQLVYPGWIELCSGHVTGAPQSEGTPGPHILWTAYYSRDQRAKVAAHFMKLLGKENHVQDSTCDSWRLLQEDSEQSVRICAPGSEGPWSACEKQPPPEVTTIVVSSMIRPSNRR